MFFGCTVLADNKENKFGSSDQGASPSTGKNTGVVLLPCCTWTCDPAAISSVADISMFTGFHLL